MCHLCIKYIPQCPPAPWERRALLFKRIPAAPRVTRLWGATVLHPLHFFDCVHICQQSGAEPWLSPPLLQVVRPARRQAQGGWLHQGRSVHAIHALGRARPQHHHRLVRLRRACAARGSHSTSQQAWAQRLLNPTAVWLQRACGSTGPAPIRALPQGGLAWTRMSATLTKYHFLTLSYPLLL